MNFSASRIWSGLSVLVAVGGLLATRPSLASAGDWPNWRGPNGNGSVEAGNFPAKWDASKPLWKADLPGKGTSTPAVHAGRVYVTCPAKGEDAVLAFDLAGKLLWETHVGAEEPAKHKTLASSGNASPATDGHSLFVYFKSGNFAALDFGGTVLWKANLVEKFGRDQLFWDQGTSPVVTEKYVILARMHGGESWVAGFDKTTGELRWKESRNYKAPNENDNGYSTPVFFQHRGREAFLLWAADHLTAHDAANGKLLWSCDRFNPQGTGFWPAIATPVVVGGMAVVPVGRDDRSQARVHGIKLDGGGDVSETNRAWQREDTGVFVTTPVAYQGRVYLLRHRGEIVCLDPATGKTFWTGTLPEHRTPYYSSPTIGNGILYAAREDGVVFAARVGEKFELLGENPMGERVIACPVPAAGRLFIRGDSHLFCVGEGK